MYAGAEDILVSQALYTELFRRHPEWTKSACAYDLRSRVVSTMILPLQRTNASGAGFHEEDVGKGSVGDESGQPVRYNVSLTLVTEVVKSDMYSMESEFFAALEICLLSL